MSLIKTIVVDGPPIRAIQFTELMRRDYPKIEVESNLTAAVQLDNRFFLDQSKGVAIAVMADGERGKRLTWKNEYGAGDIRVNTFEEFKQAVSSANPVPPIYVGLHEVRFEQKSHSVPGILVGCQFVPSETVKRIYNRIFGEKI